jgi:hypothetical protein
MSSPARRVAREKEREVKRAAARRRRAAGEGVPAGGADAAAAVAAMAGNGAPPGMDPSELLSAAMPGQAPLEMDELPPEAKQAINQALAAQGAPQDTADDSQAPAGAKRAKRYLVLERELTELLMLPTIPAAAANDQYCVTHFATKSRPFAAQLTAQAEKHTDMYRALKWAAGTGSLLTLAATGAGFLLPPLMHHGLIPAPQAMRDHYGVPTRHAAVEAVPDLAQAA